jgi:hypothetical protein
VAITLKNTRCDGLETVDTELLYVLMTNHRTSGPGTIFPLLILKKIMFRTTFTTISSFVGTVTLQLQATHSELTQLSDIFSEFRLHF